MNATTNPNLPSFDTDSLLALLFEKAAPHLNAQELAWIARQSAGCISQHGRNLADTMMTIGCMVTSDESKWMADSESLSKLLFVLSHQTGVLAEMVAIAADAKHRLEG